VTRVVLCKQVPLLIGSTFILLRAAFCIGANLTTNESIVNVRYEYLRGPDGTFWNYFDRGVVSNCIQFWLSGSPGPDWALIYQRETQVVLSFHCILSVHRKLERTESTYSYRYPECMSLRTQMHTVRSRVT
jgi:hypothetical protein